MAKGTIILPVQSAKTFGSFITTGARTENADGVWKLLFSTDQTESAIWQFRVPQDFDSGTAPELKFIYSMASDTSPQTVDLEAEIMAVSDGDAQDIDSSSFDTLNEIGGGTEIPGTAGHIDEISIILSNNDSMAANDLVIIRVNRDHDDADDNASGDLELLACSFEYTLV